MTKFKLLTAAISAIALIIILVWVQGGFHYKVPGGETKLALEKNAKLKTVKAELLETAGDVTVSGTILARDTARVAARVGGYVVELKIDAGSVVKKGDLLLKIEARELDEREAQAKAALESAKVDLETSKRDFERYKVLFDEQAIAKKQFDDVSARYEMAQATENKARSALDEAKTFLSYGLVTAPFDGVVSEKDVNQGDLAAVGRQLLAVYDPNSLEMVAAAGEQYAPFLAIGTPVLVAVPSLNTKESTSIRDIVPQRDEKTRTITVKAPLHESKVLMPGLYGTLTFKTISAPVIVAPVSAVKTVGQLETVRVLDNGAVKTRHVKIGRILEDGKIEILSGLDPGDEIVIEQ
ncbi:MAG: efflux RND transporter periplasmic adaptor subunit [Deltaproteobacteria bacterium]|nr:efflux RND transporter periplasmic adaptor subunit [Deltaproteobacteria bacterium]